MSRGTDDTQGSARCGRGRRSLFMGLALLAVLALCLGLGACGGGGGDELSVVVYGSEYPVNSSLDPNNDYAVTITHINVYETLTRYDETTKEPIPWLAESWDTSADGLTWTFHLRQGVKFQDGSAFDSASVQATIERSMQGMMAYIYTAIDTIDTPDANTVVFNLKTPYPMADMLASAYGAFMVSKNALDKFGEAAFDPGNGAGTGPYMLKEVKTTTEATLERNPNYWGGWEGDHAKAPDVAIIRQITEPAVRIQNLEQGVVQVISSAPYSELDRLSKNSDLKVYAKPSHYYLSVKLNCKEAPCSDINLRAAMYHAFPFQDVVDLVYGGYATVSLGWINKPMYGYDQAVAQLPAQAQDMAKAKEFLAKSAYPDGNITLVCLVDNSSSETQKAMELYKTALSELNITLDVQPTQPNVMATAATEEDPPQDVFCMAIGAAYCDSINAMESDVCSWVPWSNLSYWSDPQVDQLISDAYVALATDRASAPQKIIDAIKIVRESYSTIMATDLDTLAVASSKLKGFEGFKGGYPYMVFFYDVWMED